MLTQCYTPEPGFDFSQDLSEFGLLQLVSGYGPIVFREMETFPDTKGQEEAKKLGLKPLVIAYDQFIYLITKLAIGHGSYKLITINNQELAQYSLNNLPSQVSIITIQDIETETLFSVIESGIIIKDNKDRGYFNEIRILGELLAYDGGKLQ
jgi:hypothetical protein